MEVIAPILLCRGCITQMRKKKLRKREEAGVSSSLGLEAAIQESSNSLAANGTKTGSDHGSRAARAAKAAAKAKEDEGEGGNKGRFERALERAGARASEKLADSFVAKQDDVRCFVLGFCVMDLTRWTI